MSDYMKTDTKLLPYLPSPRFLLGADLTQTVKVLYAVWTGQTSPAPTAGWTRTEISL